MGDLGGLVLQSPLESGARALLNSVIGTIGYPLDPFKSYEKIDKVEAPTCIVNGTDDSVVPCSNGRNLYAALQRRGKAATPLWLPGRGHNDMPEAQVFEHVAAFL